MNNVHIKVCDGNIFEGNFGHWEDVFFSFPAHFKTIDRIDSIKAYCKKMDWKIEIETHEKERSEPFTPSDRFYFAIIGGLGLLIHSIVFYAVYFMVNKYM